MTGNQENHVSDILAGESKQIDWILPDWKVLKDTHVSVSTCDVTLSSPNGGTAQVRYGLIWTNQRHAVSIYMGRDANKGHPRDFSTWPPTFTVLRPTLVGTECITKYLGLTVEALQWPEKNSALKVAVCWNRRITTDGSGLTGYGCHPYHFKTSVRLDPTEIGKRITLFDNLIPDATWDVLYNGEHRLQPLHEKPLPDGADLILKIACLVATA